MKTQFLLLFFTLITCLHLPAQSWEWVQQLGGSGNEAAEELQTSTDGAIFLAGSYQEDFSLGEQLLPWGGESDAYLCRMDAEGTVVWARQASGKQADRNGGMALAPDENSLYWAGSYWQEVSFGSDTLQASTGGKALFLTSYSAAGELRWLKSLEGSGLKSVGHLAAAADGSLYLCGYFGGTLSIDDTTLIAAGEADLFLARFDADGQLDWARNYGISGFIEGTDMEVLPDNSVYLSGHFKGELAMAGDTIKTNTADNDLFISRIDAQGQAQWLRKAGGVHEDICRATAIDAEGRLYLSGYFYGILKLSDEISLQATGFNDNFYLLQYNEDGEALWARAYGGEGLVHAMDVEWKAGELVLGGYFRQKLSIGSVTYDAGNNFNSFVAGFALDGSLKWSQQMASTEISLLDELALLADGQYLCAGSFRSTVSFDSQELTSAGAYDVYLSRGNDGTTSLAPLPQSKSIRLYPNPVDRQLFIDALPEEVELQISDALGRPLWQGARVTEIDVSALLPGSYFLRLISPTRQEVYSFIKL